MPDYFTRQGESAATQLSMLCNEKICFVLILRCYKSHTWYPACPKGAKYIVIYREPCAAFCSYFNFFKGWMFEPGKVALSEFVTEFLFTRGVPKNIMERSSYFVHLLSWWEHRYAIRMLRSLAQKWI
jgi:hypothetical protein